MRQTYRIEAHDRRSGIAGFTEWPVDDLTEDDAWLNVNSLPPGTVSTFLVMRPPDDPRSLW